MNAFKKYNLPWRYTPTALHVKGLEELTLLNTKLSSDASRMKHIKKLRKRWVRNSEESEELRDDRLVTGHKFVEAFPYFTLTALGSAHAAFAGEPSPSPFRTGLCVSRDQQGKVVNTFPDAQDLEDLYRDLIEWDKTHHGQFDAMVIHNLLLAIHFFDDCNGRIARALEYSRWRSSGVNFSQALHPEIIIHLNPVKYVEALQQSCNTGSSEVFVEFMLETYLDYARGLINQKAD